ncbi:hypothetical protein A9P82_13610 [Arachidicoccus ginsenosidimutans]|nr:hypothetical protein A9P82_13610 [Arachidicoccus sp. BS20]
MSIVNAQNIYQLHSNFSKCKFGVLHEVINGKIDSTPRHIAHNLKGFVSKRLGDTLLINFWDINKNYDSFKQNKDIINSCDNDSSFAYIIQKSDWVNGISFTIPFSSWAFTPLNIPFRYRLEKNSDLEAQFLNTGVNFLKIWGKAKYFKKTQINPREHYWGTGVFLAFSQQALDSANTNGKVMTKDNIAAISYGINGIYSINHLGFTLALGFDNAIGANAKYWTENNGKHGLKPWIGFGVALGLTALSFNSSNSNK